MSEEAKGSASAHKPVTGLLAIEMAALNWQETIQQTQQRSATTTDLLSKMLMDIYQDGNNALHSHFRKVHYSSYSGDKSNYLPDTNSTYYSERISIWQTKYNMASQAWQNLENKWQSAQSAGSSETQSLGTASQEASEVSAVVTQIYNMVETLLQKQM